MERTVNPSALPSVVRIHSLPPNFMLNYFVWHFFIFNKNLFLIFAFFDIISLGVFFMSKNFFISDNYLEKVDKWWRAANYISLAQLYLKDNPLLREPLKAEHLKKKFVGHWGTVPGQNFIYAHCNRVICKFNLDMILLSGPGHGGNFFTSNSYLEGTYSEVYPNIGLNKEGLTKFCKQFSFPCGVSSHVAPEQPGSIHEGGELGYVLAHAFGAVFDNPDLIATAIIGDGEAETGPLATSWHSNKFLNPEKDGAVLPILHLNGYKISNPTILSRIPRNELIMLLKGYGWNPIFVEGSDPKFMHKTMAVAMDKCINAIKKIQYDARNSKLSKRPIWPMIVLATPKGWTCPKTVDNKVVEGSFRAHQVPVTMDKPEHIGILEKWLKSYRPQELFDENYKLKDDIADIAPKGKKRISANPHANGGLLLRNLRTPDFVKFAVPVSEPGQSKTQDMLELGGYIGELFKLNPNNFRMFCPDEAMSNRLSRTFNSTNRTFLENIIPTDEFLSHDGRFMDSYLSEHMCEGWLEGYLLTGRHGAFASYEAFIRVIDSMVSQHAKWLKVTSELDWRAKIASLNLLLTSNVWQQDHNGYTHQDPGFLDHVANKKSDIVRIYLPPDANCLLSCFDHCIRSKNYVNVIVASKHPSFQWLNIDDAINHCTQGIGIWKWASTDLNCEPDVVLACAGHVPTLEALATVSILHEKLPNIKIRFVNIVDLMKLEANHPHGLSDDEFDNIFTVNKPVIVVFHGYPKLIHELVYSRHNKNIKVFGYEEEGTITTPFDMRVQNKIDRFNLVKEILFSLPDLGGVDDHIIQEMNNLLVKHKKYIAEKGIDMPIVENWVWKPLNKKNKLKIKK